MTKGTQTLQNEIVFYNPQEPLDEELSALLVSRFVFSLWYSGVLATTSVLSFLNDVIGHKKCTNKFKFGDIKNHNYEGFRYQGRSGLINHKVDS